MPPSKDHPIDVIPVLGIYFFRAKHREFCIKLKPAAGLPENRRGLW